MGLISGTVTIAATNTPQSVQSTMLPALPSISFMGVQYPAGSVSQYPKQIILEAKPGNAAPVSTGTRNMTATSGTGASILAGGSANLGQMDSGIRLDELFVMGTAGDVVLVQLVD